MSVCQPFLPPAAGKRSAVSLQPLLRNGSEQRCKQTHLLLVKIDEHGPEMHRHFDGTPSVAPFRNALEIRNRVERQAQELAHLRKDTARVGAYVVKEDDFESFAE
jgi:hypothetical protein